MSHLSRSVVEDQSEREALARSDGRDAVPDRRCRPASCRFDWSLARGEDEAVAERKHRRGSAGLRSRTLLDEQELASGVVDARFAEIDDDLEWKHQVAVEISMQGVPVALAVPEQDRGRLLLSGVVAHIQPVVEGVGPGCGSTQLGPP